MDESPESAIETPLNNFKAELDASIEGVRDDGVQIELNNFGSYGSLIGHEGEMMEVLRETLGFDHENPGNPTTQYTMQGTPAEAGEGEIQVSVYATNDPPVFIGKYTYPDSSFIWALRPLTLDEE